MEKKGWKSADKKTRSPRELHLLLEESHAAGLIEGAQRDAVARVFGLGERRVAEIMTPRHEIDWVDLTADPEVRRRQIRACQHDHILVCRGEIDDIVGVVRKQDLLDRTLDGEAFDLEAAARPPHVVPEFSAVLRVIEAFKAEPHRVAVVVDEYGVVHGLLTQTDLVVAMSGAFAPDPDAPAEVVACPDGTLVLDGMMPAFAAFDRLALPTAGRGLPYTTLAGFLIHQIGDIPSAGQTFTVGGWILEVISMNGRRIDRVHARPTATSRATRIATA